MSDSERSRSEIIDDIQSETQSVCAKIDRILLNLRKLHGGNEAAYRQEPEFHNLVIAVNKFSIRAMEWEA